MINNFKKLKFYIKFKNLHKSKKTILIKKRRKTKNQKRINKKIIPKKQCSKD